MGFKLGRRSRSRLKGVHPDLVAVLELAIARTPLDFTVLEGVRSLERQKELFASGASTTLNSRHLTGHAVDIAPLVGGKVSWAWPHYYRLETVIKQAADDLGVPITWGGDWKSFKDGPHWELKWSSYPKDSPKVERKEPKKWASKLHSFLLQSRSST
ncbi:M15 family metallopeptidase [Shimia sp.]|uniref:M15 family metallopeptidase n=1 Tax=Shimia sp. TaxID=1954381 RepID=UPI003BAA41D9